MKIDKIKRKYKDEWVVGEILKEDDLGKPVEIKVLAHSKSRDDTYRALRKAKDKYTYHFYTGEIPKKGYAGGFFMKLNFDPEIPVIVITSTLIGINGKKRWHDNS